MCKQTCLFLFFVATMYAQLTPQPNSAVVGAGYHAPALLHVAPGQVITVFVSGLSTVTSRVQSGAVPIASKLGAISAAYYLSRGPGSPSVPVPILSLTPVSPDCGILTGQNTVCGGYAAVTIQIPFEIPTNLPLATGLPPVMAYLEFAENGHVATSVPIYGELDQVHILVATDALFLGALPSPLPRPLVFRPNGTQVGWRNQASAGEAVTLYAVGLGNLLKVNVQTGTPPKNPIAVDPPVISFDFRINAEPSSPGSSGSPAHADYAGMVAGFVGLYQINLTLPAVPPNIVPCNQDALGYGTGVYSNLTINLRGFASFDGAGICVSP